jgi:hypothetical protein
VLTHASVYRFKDAADALVQSEVLLDDLVRPSGGGGAAPAAGLAAVDPQALQALRRVLLQRRTAVEFRLRECAACAVAVEQGGVAVARRVVGAAVGAGRMGEGTLLLADVLEVRITLSHVCVSMRLADALNVLNKVDHVCVILNIC